MIRSNVARFTNGIISYIVRAQTDDGKAPVRTITNHEDGTRSRISNFDMEQRLIEVSDMRTADKSFSLQKEGFILRHLQAPMDLDWQDEKQVQFAMTMVSGVKEDPT